MVIGVDDIDDDSVAETSSADRDDTRVATMRKAAIDGCGSCYAIFMESSFSRNL